MTGQNQIHRGSEELNPGPFRSQTRFWSLCTLACRLTLPRWTSTCSLGHVGARHDAGAKNAAGGDPQGFKAGTCGDCGGHGPLGVSTSQCSTRQGRAVPGDAFLTQAHVLLRRAAQSGLLRFLGPSPCIWDPPAFRSSAPHCHPTLWRQRLLEKAGPGVQIRMFGEGRQTPSRGFCAVVV